MEIIGELFIEIVGAIAELIGESLAKSIGDDYKTKRPVARCFFAIAIGLLCWAVIGALGFATYVLFVNSHPVAGFLTAVLSLFFIVLFISVIVKLNQIKKKK